MPKSNSYLRLFIDLSINLGCLYFAYIFVSFYCNYNFPFSYVNIYFLIPSWYISSRITSLYRDFFNRTISDEIMKVYKTIFINTVSIILADYLLVSHLDFTRAYLFLFLIFQILLFPLSKWVLRWSFSNKFKKFRHKYLINVLVVGAGDLALKFDKIIQQKYYSNYKIYGFVDDNIKNFLSYKYFGTINDLSNFFQKNEVDEVVVSLSHLDHEKISTIVSISESYGKRVRILPDYSKFSSGFTFSNFGGLPILSVRKLPLDDPELKLFKRIFDISFSFILILFIFSWLFPIIILFVKFNSKGPAFFLQERWGINGNKILCYKFRTMFFSVNNEIDLNGKFNQTKKNDSRITKVGSYLRKYNLDELPQFFNVLKGEMSIVGPRPHASLQNEEFKFLIENYMLRHLVKPGITGWAQSNGFRGETSEIWMMQKRIEYDIWYIENANFWLDIQIILQTILNMIKGDSKAY